MRSVPHVVPLQRPRKRSPSQVKTYKGCERRWGFQKFHGLREPDTAATNDGKEGHGYLEQWFKGGQPPPADKKMGKAAMAAIPYLPIPSPHLEVEHYLTFAHEGLEYHGFADLHYWLPSFIPNVTDHKFTGNLNFALDYETIRDDEQALIYAMYCLKKYPGIEQVEVHWNYTDKNSCQVVPVKRLLRKDEIEEGFAGIHEVNKRMAHAELNASHALQLEPNYSHCNAYNKPCPYMDLCQVTARDVLHAVFEQEDRKMSTIKEKMQQRMEAKGNTMQNQQPPPSNGQYQQYPPQQQIPMQGQPPPQGQPPQQGYQGQQPPQQQPPPQGYQQPPQQQQPPQGQQPPPQGQPPQQQGYQGQQPPPQGYPPQTAQEQQPPAQEQQAHPQVNPQEQPPLDVAESMQPPPDLDTSKNKSEKLMKKARELVQFVTEERVSWLFLQCAAIAGGGGREQQRAAHMAWKRFHGKEGHPGLNE